MKKIIGAIAIALLFTGCSNSKELKLVVNDTKGIETTCAAKSQREITCSLKNNGNKTIDLLNLYVAAYNKNNKLVTTVSTTAQAVAKGKEVVLSANYDASETIKDISKVEIATLPTYYTEKQEIVDYYNDIKVDYNKEKNSDVFKLNIANTKGNALGTVSVSVLFYKNNKLINAQDAFVDSIEQSVTEVISIPYKDNKKIDYDKIRTVVNYARNNM